MPADPNLQRLLARANRALGEHDIPDAVAKFRAIIGTTIPAGEVEASAAWTKLRNGEAPTPDELMALEIVIRLLRPAPLSRAGQLADLPDQQGHNLYPQELKDQWSAFRAKVQPLLYSIGRVNLTDGTHIGTGFLVADDLLATNRHVLADLSFGTEVLRPRTAQVVFQGEDGTANRPEHIADIRGARDVHPTLDIALLELAPTSRPVPVISAASLAEGERVVAIGYPAKDGARNPLFLDSVFAGKYGVKRAALGEVLDGSATPDLFHDCSTLGGNSGSPIFSLETAEVVGIHRGGFFMYRNEALDGASLDHFVSG